MGTIAIIILGIVALLGTINFFVAKSDIKDKDTLIKQLENDRRMVIDTNENLNDTIKSLRETVRLNGITISDKDKEIKRLEDELEGVRAVKEQQTEKVSEKQANNIGTSKPAHQDNDNLPIKPKSTKKKLGNNNKK